MSLQVRLRHPLGERLLELPDRPVDEPVVVGRSSTADVQVPSVTVASRHCVLFVHEGSWAVQGVSGGAGTFLNGRRLEGPAGLRVGDVVTLGAEQGAPVIEVDPIGAGQGRKGQPARSDGVAPAAAASPPPQASSAVPPPAQAAQPANPAPTAPVPVAGDGPPLGQTETHAAPSASEHALSAGEGVGAPAGVDTIAWPAEATGTSTYYSRPRPRRSNSGLNFAVLLTLALLGAGAFFYYQHRQEAARVASREGGGGGEASKPSVPTTRPTPDSVPVRPVPSERTRPGRTTASASRPSTQMTLNQPGGDDPADDSSDEPIIGVVEPLTEDSPDAATTQPGPQAEDPDWKRVQAARVSQDEAKAVLAFDGYALAHPNERAAELAEYTDHAVDRVWFERLDQLCKQREEFAKRIQETEKETAEETNDAYKRRVLVPLKGEYAKRLQAVEEELKSEMKYEAAASPNLYDEAQLEKLRRQRDPAAYAAWKQRVLAHIRQTNGQLPWTSH